MGNIVGSQRTAGPARELDEFDPDFAYIKEPLGGFGLYYRAAMEATGLVQRTDLASGIPYDTVTPLGKALAAAYRSAVGDTTLATDYLADAQVTGPVPRDVLVQFARQGCLCQLATAQQADLPLLQDLFTHVGDATGARRRTLRFLLDLSTVTNEPALTQDRFRQLIYFREPGRQHLHSARRDHGHRAPMAAVPGPRVLRLRLQPTLGLAVPPRTGDVPRRARPRSAHRTVAADPRRARQQRLRQRPARRTG